MLYNLHVSLFKMPFFHNAILFGFCITHILNTGVLKFEKKSVAKRLNTSFQVTALLNLHSLNSHRLKLNVTSFISILISVGQW